MVARFREEEEGMLEKIQKEMVRVDGAQMRSGQIEKSDEDGDKIQRGWDVRKRGSGTEKG